MKHILFSAMIAGTTLASAVIAQAGNAWTSSHTALNARSGPGTSHHVLRKFSRCTKVHVIKHHHGWAKVGYKGHHYWVSAKYLRHKPCGGGHHKFHTHHHRHGHGHGHTHKHQMNVGHH